MREREGGKENTGAKQKPFCVYASHYVHVPVGCFHTLRLIVETAETKADC